MATTTLEVRDRMARRRRRMLLPVLTVVAGLAVWYLNVRVGPGREADVEVFARRLLAEAAPPRPSVAGIAGTEPVISDLVRETLRDMSADGAPPTFTLRRGDLAQADGRATHTVEITDGDGTRMVLRIVHTGDAQRLVIVGVELGGKPNSGRAPGPVPVPEPAGNAAPTLESGGGS